jgi:hypothetical protein
MQIRRMASGAALIASALVLVVQVSSVGADGRGNHRGRVEVTFTKWVLNGGPFMAGATGGDIEGKFYGEILENVASKRVSPVVSHLAVIYEVQAADPSRSFTSLIEGGAFQGKALLDGVIVGGWRRGAHIHVDWTATPQASCPAAPAGAGPVCFVGKMTIERLDDDED